MKIKVNGNEVSVITNRRTRPAIILLHGNSLSSASFIKQYDSDKFNDIQMVGIDFPGHGQSQWSENPESHYNLFHFRDVVLKIIDELKIGSFILAGHSIGGHVAMECTPYLKNCRGLVLWGAPPVKLPLDVASIFLPTPLQHLLFTKTLSPSDVSALASLLINQNYILPVSEMIGQCDPEFRGHFPGSLANSMVSDEYQLVINSRLPVAILHGDHDRLINFDYYNSLDIPSLWRNEVIKIKNASHSPHMESPEVFNDLLYQFYSETI